MGWLAGSGHVLHSGRGQVYSGRNIPRQSNNSDGTLPCTPLHCPQEPRAASERTQHRTIKQRQQTVNSADFFIDGGGKKERKRETEREREREREIGGKRRVMERGREKGKGKLHF